MLLSIFIALSLSIFNLLTTIVITSYSMKKNWEKLYKLVFGSMVIKYFLNAFIIWLILTYIEMNVLAFALTFLIATFIVVFVEILFIHNRSKTLNL